MDIQKVLDNAEQKYLENTIKNAILTIPGGDVFLDESKCSSFMELQQKACKFLDVNLRIRNSSNISKIINTFLTVLVKLLHDKILIKNCDTFGLTEDQLSINFKNLIDSIHNSSEEQINLIKLRSCLSVAKQRFSEEHLDSIPSVFNIIGQTWSSSMADYISSLILPKLKEVMSTEHNEFIPQNVTLTIPNSRKRKLSNVSNYSASKYIKLFEDDDLEKSQNIESIHTD